MKPINLLPRKPFLAERFVPLLGGLVAVYALTAAMLAFGAASADQERLKEEAEIDELRIQMVLLREQRIPAPEAQRFELYKNIVAVVEGERYDWPSAMREMAAPLPLSARLLDAAFAPEEATITIDAQFGSLEDVTAYVEALRKLAAFDQVLIAALAAESAAVAAEAAAEPPVVQEPSAAFDASEDPLLRELEWIIFREAMLQESGVALPADGPALAEPADERLEQSFSPEEIESAREAASRYRAEEAAPVEEIAVPTVTYYRAELTLHVAGLQPSEIDSAEGEGGT